MYIYNGRTGTLLWQLSDKDRAVGFFFLGSDRSTFQFRKSQYKIVSASLAVNDRDGEVGGWQVRLQAGYGQISRFAGTAAYVDIPPPPHSPPPVIHG